MKYTVAADGRTKLQSRNLRVGQTVTPFPSFVPRGVLHAVLEEGDTTMCGTDVAGLARFPRLNFLDWPASTRCPTCQLLTAE